MRFDFKEVEIFVILHQDIEQVIWYGHWFLLWLRFVTDSGHLHKVFYRLLNTNWFLSIDDSRKKSCYLAKGLQWVSPTFITWQFNPGAVPGATYRTKSLILLFTGHG